MVEHARLTGDGDTSFESEEEVSSTFSQHTLINEGVDASQVKMTYYL